MEKVEESLHKHSLIPFTRFAYSRCKICSSPDDDLEYIYGGYRCNELGCDDVVFHKDCAKLFEEINHPYHPDHPLKLIILDRSNTNTTRCTLCVQEFKVGYSCSTCVFKLDFKCARRRNPILIPANSYGHEHQLELFYELMSDNLILYKDCKGCHTPFFSWRHHYKCLQCDFATHLGCVSIGPEAYHTSHLKHPLKSLKCEAALGYADKKCLLCEHKLDEQLHHCAVCNFSICRACMKNPPPVGVECPTTHEHQLHLVPRRIDFTCDACGTLGDRSPYFCLQCNFMIHRQCIDLPRLININRHVHRISYTTRFGQEEWKCGVCRKNVVGFYGAYSCSKCSDYVVHSRCATRKDVWDMIELEGKPEESEESAPFEVIDENMIKHFSHEHNLAINIDGVRLPERMLCVACIFQICSEPFYSCQQCDFILHEKCANLPRKKRHVCHNKPLTLQTDSLQKKLNCKLCHKQFTGFRYQSDSQTDMLLDIRCSSISEPFFHESHPHPLYYTHDHSKTCTECKNRGELSCDECMFSLDFRCATLPQKVMRNRYDDHPLFLSYGEKNVNGEYWCEACETKVKPEKWFYACNDCGITLHISCLVGDFSYVMPTIRRGTCSVSNNSICRPLCYGCNSRCKLPSVLRISQAGDVVYVCSLKCLSTFYSTIGKRLKYYWTSEMENSHL